jgi:hypothetical protein
MVEVALGIAKHCPLLLLVDPHVTALQSPPRITKLVPIQDAVMSVRYR